ncbi:hypothetical protein [Sphingobium sp. HDIP04]|uniref:hypothetical protein n=1 Tax=Sphingobium sp. HDIP04 TaxID=428994 RepID=UPI0003878023|nr:hypothetical protein [Sphingobium sp. HDIP04]EQB03681.1 hypothetical protein L286_11695 [Sphingobium sp. HDIP04]
MTMRIDLRSRLVANAAISAIVGPRIYWNKRKQGDPLPAMVLYKITPGNQYTFDGDSGLYGSHIQFDSIGLEVRDFEPLFDALKAEMEQPRTVGQTAFSMSFLEGERDMPFVDVDGVGAVGGISADFFVWWKSL